MTVHAALPAPAAYETPLAAGSRRPAGWVLPPHLAVATLACGLVASAATLGGDARWAAVLGGSPHAAGSLEGIPYASAPSADWRNVPALGEAVLHVVAEMGGAGWLGVQLLAVAVALSVVAHEARSAQAAPGSVAVVLALLVTGSLPALVIVRLQVFSLALFPVLLLLLRRQHREPSAAVWLLVPLIAVWANLHGAVLIGLAVTLGYLVVDRARLQPLMAAAVAAACAAAMCATPAGIHTPAYFAGLLDNELARRGIGLWAAPSWRSPLDLAMLAVAALFLVLTARARPAAWECATVVGLSILTVHTARSGVWLLLFTAVPAARGLGARRRERRARLLPATATAAGLGLLALAIVRGPHDVGVPLIVRQAVQTAAGTPVLAEGVAGEQVVEAGGRVWVTNPLDAFSRADQVLYVDWLEGLPRGDIAVDHVPAVVLVRAGSKAALRMATRRDTRLVRAADGLELYRRTGR